MARKGPVTAVDENSKLAALRRARERLELALAVDDSWLTLRRSRAAAGSGEASRLEAGLLSNPLYRAWKNVNAAIEARQRIEPVGALPANAEPPGSQPPSAAAGEGSMKPAAAIVAAATEEEASVSFVARTPMLAPPLPAPPHWRPAPFAQQLERLPAEQGSDQARPDAGQSEEAEVSVVSVDARRHAGAVERLLRALRGDKSAQ